MIVFQKTLARDIVERSEQALHVCRTSAALARREWCSWRTGPLGGRPWLAVPERRCWEPFFEGKWTTSLMRMTGSIMW
ncbi:hypothetical protein E2C01_101089 [Portunus trituberculatus]|uniref:Uncharacterized protein n=1 Tax=Portunus trituberculatus TaxID=210409 RepID=A0A5B7KDU9_PORTR|nr:hypothetical protein [Portunus trituberculatus]